MHRPWMDWDAAAHRHDPAAIAGRVFGGLAHLGRLRATLPSLHAAVESEPLDCGVAGLLVLVVLGVVHLRKMHHHTA